MQSQFHHGLEDIYDREDRLQKQAVREFMQDHFKRGLDPPVQTFEKGTITSMNMISEKYNLTAAERVQLELE